MVSASAPPPTTCLPQCDTDRVRLREEHARVEALHASLRVETEILRGDVAKERQRLREERQDFEATKRDLVTKLQQAQQEAEVRRWPRVGPSNRGSGAWALMWAGRPLR